MVLGIGLARLALVQFLKFELIRMTKVHKGLG